MIPAWQLAELSHILLTPLALSHPQEGEAEAEAGAHEITVNLMPYLVLCCFDCDVTEQLTLQNSVMSCSPLQREITMSLQSFDYPKPYSNKLQCAVVPLMVE